MTALSQMFYLKSPFSHTMEDYTLNRLVLPYPIPKDLKNHLFTTPPMEVNQQQRVPSSPIPFLLTKQQLYEPKSFLPIATLHSQSPIPTYFQKESRIFPISPLSQIVHTCTTMKSEYMQKELTESLTPTQNLSFQIVSEDTIILLTGDVPPTSNITTLKIQTAHP